MLCSRRGVKAHDEVVSSVMYRLKFAGGLGEEECTPVCDAADDAVLLEDDLASRFGNPGGC